MKHYFAVAWVILLAVTTRPVGAVTIDVTHAFKMRDLTSDYQHFQDSTNQLGPEAVAARPDEWGPVEGKSLSAGATHWLRFNMKNDGDEARPFVCEFEYALLDYVSFFQPQPSGKFVEERSGDAIPFSQRRNSFRTHVFFSVVPAHSETTFYVTVRTASFPTLSSAVWDPDEFARSHSFNENIFASLYGMLLALLLYNCFLYVQTRERAFLIYNVFVSLDLMLYTTWNGFGFQHFWPNSLYFENVAMPVLLVAIMVAAQAFAYEFLNLKASRPFFKAVTISLLVAGIPTAPLIFVLDTRTATAASMIYLLVTSFSLCIAGCYTALKRYRPGYFFALAFGIQLLTGIYAVVAVMGILPFSEWTRFSNQISFVLNTIVISLGVGDKFNLIRQQSLRTQLKLRQNLETLLDGTRRMAAAPHETEAGRIAAAAIVREATGIQRPTIEFYQTKEGKRLKTAHVTNGVPQDDPKSEALADWVPAAAPWDVILPIETQSTDRSCFRVVSGDQAPISGEDLGFMRTLISSLEIALQNIRHTHHLAELVDVRTAALSQALAKITDEKDKQRYLLENMRHGIVTFDESMMVGEEYSRCFPELIGVTADLMKDRDIISLLFDNTELSRDRIDTIKGTLGSAFGQNEIAWGLNVMHLPTQIEMRAENLDKVLHLGWNQLCKDGIVVKIMLSVDDVTSEVAVKEKLRQTEESNHLLLKRIGEFLMSDRTRARRFIAEAKTRVARLATVTDKQQAFVELHTIKGGARVFHLSEIAACAHNAEEYIRSDSDQASAQLHEAVAALATAIAGYAHVLESYLTGDGPAVSELSGSGARDLSLSGFMSQFIPTIRSSLATVAVQLKAVTIDDQVMNWSEAGYEHLTTLVMHAINNAVDHGYVLPKRRDAAAASEATLSISARHVGQSVEIAIADHGFGFDLTKLRALAASTGFVPRNSSTEALLEIVLQDGVSTAESVSTSSGRGVGMGVVNSTVKRLGGSMTLAQNKPRGAVLRIVLPSTAVCSGVVKKAA